MVTNPYETLGVKENASQDEIKAAYRELVKKYHPDRYQNNPLADLAAEKMRDINEAYDMLTKGQNGQGSGSGSYGGSYSGGGQPKNSPEFQAVRRDIDMNNLASAEAKLNNIPVKNAEWIFLSGMISYKKGWYDDARGKIQQACNMAPNDPEYGQALNALNGAGQGYRNMAYGQGYNTNEDVLCQACQCAMCADFCTPGGCC